MLVLVCVGVGACGVGVGACGAAVGACGLGIGACGVDACVGSALLPPKPIAMPAIPAIPAKPVKPAAAKPGLAHAVPTPFRTQLIQPSGASILDVDVVDDDSDDSDEIIEIPAPQPDQNGPANARPGPANQSIERSMRRMDRTVAKRKAENIHFQGS